MKKKIEYKIVYSDDTAPKKGTSQEDLYQMVAYGIRFNIDKIILFYPNTIRRTQDKICEIKIIDEFANREKPLRIRCSIA